MEGTKFQLLLSEVIGNPNHYPFTTFHAENLLPAALYTQLADDFPHEDWFVDGTVGEKRRFGTHASPEVFLQFRSAFSGWDAFMRQFETPEFLKDLYPLIYQSLRSSRGYLGSRPWVLAESVGLSALLTRQPVEISFEFSRIPRGGLVFPHTDSANKLLSLIIYFPDSSWKESYGGGTKFYRALDPALEQSWNSGFMTLDNLEVFEEAPYKPNYLVGFIKSSNSFHAMDPLECPEGIVRDSLNINIYQTWPKKLSWPEKKSLGLLKHIRKLFH